MALFKFCVIIVVIVFYQPSLFCIIAFQEHYIF